MFNQTHNHDAAELEGAGVSFYPLIYKTQKYMPYMYVHMHIYILIIMNSFSSLDSHLYIYVHYMFVRVVGKPFKNGSAHIYLFFKNWRLYH